MRNAQAFHCLKSVDASADSLLLSLVGQLVWNVFSHSFVFSLFAFGSKDRHYRHGAWVFTHSYNLFCICLSIGTFNSPRF